MSNLSLLNRQLSAYELRVLSDQHNINYPYSGFIVKSDKRQNININVQLVTSVNPDINTFLKFNVLISDFVKAESPFKDSSGKPIKMLTEHFRSALSYELSNKFEIKIVKDNTSIFLNQYGQLHNANVNLRSELAKIFLTSIELGHIDLIKHSNNIPIIAYDTTVLILLELLNMFQLDTKVSNELNTITSSGWMPLDQSKVVSCFLKAGENLKNKYKIPLIPGTLLSNCYETALKLSPQIIGDKQKTEQETTK